MKCTYCGETDESSLITRSSIINGCVETIDICSSCFWFKKVNVTIKNDKISSKQRTKRESVSSGDINRSGKAEHN